MRYERYKRIDNAIKASDSGGIWERWRFGRRLLCDSDATTPAGNLRSAEVAHRARSTEWPEALRT